jgi:multiphosphoryl transfer protein
VVGLVIVSHSARLADGVAEVAREMAGPDVALEVAGGLDLPDRPLGTDAALVARAIERAYSADGVVVLMDLGSAVLSAEMALDLLPPEYRDHVLLCEAPLIEGAVAAAVTARLGAPLEQVAEEARQGLRSKAAHLASDGPGGAPSTEAPHWDAATEAGAGERHTLRFAVANPLGLHARPAARFVQTVGRFDVDVLVTNLSTGHGPASGRSLNAVATLGVRQGHEVLVEARGPQAAGALDALRALADRGFDEAHLSAPPPVLAGPTSAPAPGPGGSLTGLPASPGIAFGPARHVRPAVPDVPTGRSDDPQAESDALEAALEKTAAQIRKTRSSVAARAGEYDAAIFDAHLLFLEDEALLGPARRLILEDRRNAADAWNDATQSVVENWRRLDDEYLRARAQDLVAVARQVLWQLVGDGSGSPVLEGQGILVAPDLAPAETAGLDRDVVRGIVTAFGGPTSHSAILARSLGLPAVVGLGEAVLSLPEGTSLLLDGDRGLVWVEPPPKVVTEFTERRQIQEAAVREARAAAHGQALTQDGRRIEVMANVGSPDDVREALDAGAEGIGLLRTEFLFMDRPTMPDEEEQEVAYRNIASSLGGRPLVLRTLDVGADKPLPYLPQPAEANPFLGTRGIRLALAHRELLAGQLRAALRVAADHPISVMFPMVATLDELRAAREVLEEARTKVTADLGRVIRPMEIGVMVEVPSVALTAERFAPEVDFFSVGTNDLAQYTLAAERGNERVAALADALHPSVLRLIQLTVEAAEALGRWVGVCGELAGDPLAIPILVGLGVRELSMAPPAIPVAKHIVRRWDLDSARSLSAAALRLDSGAAVRQLATEARELHDRPRPVRGDADP